MVTDNSSDCILMVDCSLYVLIGISFVITKKGLQRASTENGYASDSYNYLKNPIWWVGLLTMVGGELLNFIGYTFAPAILITPLGALSVIIGAVLASVFLKEKLGPIGIVGCLLSVLGAVIIVLHAPEDPDVQSVHELVGYMLQSGFITYAVLVALTVFLLIWKAVPRWGKSKVIVYIAVCSLVGSLSVMMIKAFGIAVRLTLAGNNQFTQPSTYIFAFLCLVFVLTQINYFNKALDVFSTNVVNPIYYVCFTTATITASAIMYQGQYTTTPINIASLICGFLILFSGVYLLNTIALTGHSPASNIAFIPFASTCSLEFTKSKDTPLSGTEKPLHSGGGGGGEELTLPRPFPQHRVSI
ncbi:magnesium transporter [Spinellus fusiger]|nr:magnesium transporter [Spinellus fusiger]